MIDPYSDKETSTGSLLVNATTLSALTQNWAAEGYQVNIHAIGVSGLYAIMLRAETDESRILQTDLQSMRSRSL
jgi:predicted amidohydrolase YtcJ